MGLVRAVGRVGIVGDEEGSVGAVWARAGPTIIASAATEANAARMCVSLSVSKKSPWKPEVPPNEWPVRLARFAIKTRRLFKVVTSEIMPINYEVWGQNFGALVGAKTGLAGRTAGL
jgi:hypothetical protein